MLSRESSDYQWYRQRAASLHSKPILEYAATTATVSSSSELGSNSTISDGSMASSRGAKEKNGGMNGNGADVGRASGVDKSFAAVAAAADEKQGDEEVKRTKKVAKPKSNGAPGYNIVEVDAGDEDEGTISSVPAVRVNGHKADAAETDGKNGSHLADGDGAKSNSIIYEQHDNGVGSVLTTVKPSEDFEASLKHSRETRPRSRSRNSRSTERTSEKEDKQDQLQSGRRPGKGWEESAIRWAPLNVPFKRRIQTLAVLWHTLSIALFLSLFFALMAFPPAWLILTPYLIVSFVLYDDPNDGRLARRSPFLKNLKIWSAFGEYYPAQLHKTVDLEPHRKYVFGYHPHGIISHGAFAAFATEALGFSVLFPGITNTLLTLETNFRIPFYRDYALAMGLASVSRESITNILSKGGTNGRGMGRAVTIVVGGARESLQAKPGTMKLILNERKGFIKQAIRTGADLVPVLAFGENDLYDQVDSNSHPYIRKLQMLIKKAMGFTLPLFHARGIFNYDTGLMPYRRPINIVVGRPIKVVQQGQITDEKGGDEGHVEQTYLDDLHGQYVEEVRRLWETHKDRFYADREGELIID